MFNFQQYFIRYSNGIIQYYTTTTTTTKYCSILTSLYIYNIIICTSMYKYSYRIIIYIDHNVFVHFEVDEMKQINIVMWKK